jgi:hypothetical protein
MKTNDLKKGTVVILRNGWSAKLVDNRKGNRRCMTVYGDEVETGDVYAHDIVSYADSNDVIHNDIELTESQKNLMKQLKTLGF